MWRLFAGRRRRGLVRVSARELVRLQGAALRAAQLETEIRESEQGTASLAAELTALKRSAQLGVQLEQGDLMAMCEQPPLTSTGALHVEAFSALLDARLWLLVTGAPSMGADVVKGRS